MKYLIAAFAVVALFTASGTALAAPFKAVGNPQIVANYSSGTHGIPGEPYLHQGADVVMRAGNSGNFQQWFYGTSTENGGITEGDHSLWKLAKGETCPTGTTAVTVSTNPNSSNYWGDYLVNGATYCVRTNDFHVSK